MSEIRINNGILKHIHDVSLCKNCEKTVDWQETKLAEYIQQLDDSISCMTRCRKVIPPYELDIYIPNKKLAIEYDGLYWHSEANGKNKQYHLSKT